MGSADYTERVVTVLAATCVAAALAGQGVAYADKSDSGSSSQGSSSEHSESSRSGGLPHTSTDSDGRKGSPSPGHTPISQTREFPGNTSKPFDNASPNSRFRPPSPQPSDDGQKGRRIPGKFVFGRPDGGSGGYEPPVPPDDVDPPPAVKTPPPVVETPPPAVKTPPPVVETPPPVVETPPPAVETPPPVVETPPPPVDAPPPAAPQLSGGPGQPAPPSDQLVRTDITPAELPEASVQTPPASASTASMPQISPAGPVIAIDSAGPDVPDSVTVDRVPAAPALPPSADATLTSSIGTGTVALTTILLFLVAGGWYFGRRLALQLTVERDHHA